MTTSAPQERVAFKKLLWVGPLAIGAAILGNVIVWAIAQALIKPDPAFMQLSGPGPAIIFTFVGVLGAVLVYAALGRFVARPAFVFQWVSLVVLIISFLPDIGLLMAPAPGANLPNVITLMLMHVVAAAISVLLLTRLAKE